MIGFISKYKDSSLVIWSVFSLSFFCCIAFNWSYPIYILDEARNAEAAREMIANGNFIVPYFNGVLRTDKPVLHYYFMSLAYQLFGVNAFAARFFSALFGAFTYTCTFYFTKRFVSLRVALIGFIVLLSALFFVQEFHLSVPDPYLIFFTCFGLFSLYTLFLSNNWKWFFLAFISLGFGVLSKGPIALVLPGLSVFTYLVYSKQFTLKNILIFRPLLGVLLVALIAVPWFYSVHIATDGLWSEGFFLDHNLNRFNNGKEGHGGLFLLTWLFVLLGLLPFSIFLIPSLYNLLKSKDKTSIAVFSAMVGVVTLIFFSVASTKLPNYTMPCYPFLSLVIAVYLDKVHQNISYYKRTMQIGLIVLLVISLLLPLGGFIALSLERELLVYRWYALLLCILPIGSILALYFFKKNQIKKSFFFLASSWVVMGFLLFGIIYPKLTLETPTEKVKVKFGEVSNFVVLRRFDSAFPFNFKTTFEVVETLEELELFIQRNPNYYILTNIGDKDLLSELNKSYQLQLEQKALFENHTTRVYKK